MVMMDQTWENLEAIRKAVFQAPANHPDLDPAHEAMLLTEAYRELARTEAAKVEGPEFTALLHEAAANASELHQLFKQRSSVTPLDATHARRLLQSAPQKCAICHKKFRN